MLEEDPFSILILIYFTSFSFILCLKKNTITSRENMKKKIMVGFTYITQHVSDQYFCVFVGNIDFVFSSQFFSTNTLQLFIE